MISIFLSGLNLKQTQTSVKLIPQRSVRDADQIEKEEEARRKLEEKAEIYDRLQKEDGGEDDDRFLVDFGR